MKLWIRTQDKERLIKVEDLYVEFNGSTDPELDYHRIVTDRFINLGIYETKERALEVLNEISKLVENVMYHTQLNHGVLFYQMPKE